MAEPSHILILSAFVLLSKINVFEKYPLYGTSMYAIARITTCQFTLIVSITEQLTLYRIAGFFEDKNFHELAFPRHEWSRIVRSTY